MNAVFNFKRLGNLLKEQIYLSSKQLIVYITITLTLYLAFWVLIQSDYKMNDTSKTIWIMLILSSVFGLLTLSSLVTGNMKTKTSFQAFALLPASNLEKFVSKVLILSIIPLIYWIIMSFLLYFNESAVERLNFFVPSHIVMIFLFLWFLSMATFWGTLFRRFGFVIFVVATTLVIVLIVNNSDGFNNTNFMFFDPIIRYIQSGEGYGRLYFVIGSVTGVLTLINWTLSYLIYRRKEMNVKFLNW